MLNNTNIQIHFTLLNASWFIGIILAGLTLNSCGTYTFNRTKEFQEVKNSFSEINGEYYAYSIPTKNSKFSINATYLFNQELKTDFFYLTYLPSSQIKISYWVDSLENGFKKEIYLLGKKKKKYFESYFSKKQIIIPFLFSWINIDRIRIGKAHIDNLVIMHFSDRSGNILFIAEGNPFETPYIFEKLNKYDGLKPILIDKKWGYIENKTGHITIEPKYNFAQTFYLNSAIVRKENKYGLIDKKGQELTDIKFDHIKLNNSDKENPFYWVSKNKKHGTINLDGEIRIPVIYDSIYFSSQKEFFIELNNKYGLAASKGIIIPVIYDKKFWFGYNGFALVTRDGEEYFIDKEGYEYDIKSIKRKSFIAEQFTNEEKNLI